MKDLYLLRYNNYINRKVKLPKTLTQYQAYQVGNTLLNTNFYSADGIHANQTVNLDFDILGAIPDYAVITVGGSDEILEHWYILEANKIRKGQYDLTLRRDTILDYKDIIMRAKSVIARGTVAQSNPLIYNSENSKLNVIKKGETLLKDYTGMPWIVGYISQDVAIDNPVIDIKSYEQSEYQYQDITSYPFYKYRNGGTTQGDSFLAISYQKTDQLHSVLFDANSFVLKLAPVVEIESGPQFFRSVSSFPLAYINMPSNFIDLDIKSVKEEWAKVPYETKDAIAKANPTTGVSISEYNEIIANQGKIITTRSGNYKYKLIVDSYTIGSPIAQDKIDIIKGCFNTTKQHWLNVDKLKPQQVNYVNPSFHLEFETAPSPGLTKYQIKFTGKDLSNETSPYGILCMPYADGYRTLSEINDTDKGIALTKQQRLKIFQGLGAIKGLLYDVQILPYCPISTITFTNDNKDMYNVAKVKTIPVYSPSKAGLVTNFYCADSGEFSFRIYHDIDAKDIKTTNECDVWRLVSPNGAGNFEFNASKFGIHTMPTENPYFLKYFTVDCSYRPYTPYIHVAPEWSGLYGNEYHDPKGLICAGDFSVDRVSDEWSSYQYNNKNFQLQFDRQIETMEFNKKMGWVGPAGGIAGGIIGAASAIGLGDWARSAWDTKTIDTSPIELKKFMAQHAGGDAFKPSALIGGIGATAGALALGIAQHMRQNEAIAARKDDFNWTNQNIDARPYGLTKVSVLNKNNKLFPYLEYYSCTPEEQEQVQLRMTLQGMTVGAIGKIEDYLNLNKDGTHKYPPANGLYNRNYIRATIIEIPEAVSDDAHLVMAINEELAEGVYFEE